jgi:hypothetical protein
VAVGDQDHGRVAIPLAAMLAGAVAQADEILKRDERPCNVTSQRNAGHRSVGIGLVDVRLAPISGEKADIS